MNCWFKFDNKILNAYYEQNNKQAEADVILNKYFRYIHLMEIFDVEIYSNKYIVSILKSYRKPMNDDDKNNIFVKILNEIVSKDDINFFLDNIIFGCDHYRVEKNLINTFNNMSLFYECLNMHRRTSKQLIQLFCKP